MEEIKPKKERKFLKAMGDIALVLFRELVLGIGKKVINKVGNKRQGLVIAFVMVAGISYAAIDSIPYPITTNKQRLGWQTTGNGLVYRGRASDTITKPSNYTNKDIKAYLLVDTVNNVMYSYIASKGGWKFNNSDTVIIQGATMPFDSITFYTAKDGTVGVGEVEYNDTQGSLIQGLKGGNVTNVIGQQLHQRVNNRTGATLNKGDVVYLSGSQGNRITVAKAIATSDPTSANTFGIVAENIADNASGYVITEGLITNLNTSALTQDSSVYLSGTTAGTLTSTKPQAPIHGVYIGVCVKSNAGSGEIFVKIRNGSELDELHDVQISSPLNNASLYFKSNEGLWRDTTAALLVSDTSSMLTNYLRTGVAASTYLPLTGGTLTGGLTGTTGTFTGLNVNNTTTEGIFTLQGYDNNTATRIQFNTTGNIRRQILLPTADSNLEFRTSTIGGTQGGYSFYTRRNPNPSEFLSFNIDVDGNSNFYGTLGVTGATTLSNLAGTGTRMVVAGSAGLLSTQTIPTGTVTNVSGSGAISVATGTTTPVISVADAAFGTAGIVTATGTQQFSGDKVFEGITTFNGRAVFKDYTYTATRLAGLSSTDRFATVTIGTGLSLSSGTLSSTNTGTVTNVTGTLPISVANGTTTPSITIANASTTASGVVTTGTQSMAGNKTFTGDLATSGAFSATGFSTLTGGASVGTMATTSSMTHILGVNSSNAIGEIALGSGLSFSSGTLSVIGTGTFTTTNSNYTVTSSDTYIAFNNNFSNITVTLPTASTNLGRELKFRNVAAGSIISASNNVINNTVTTGTPDNSILGAGNTNYKWCTLVSDGTYWIKMSSN